MLATIHEAEKFGLGYDVVDDLTGSNLGRAKSADVIRTADSLALTRWARSSHADTLKPEIDPVRKVIRDARSADGSDRKRAPSAEDGCGFYPQGRQGLKYSTRNAVSTSRARARPTELVVRILKKKHPAESLRLLRRDQLPQAQ